MIRLENIHKIYEGAEKDVHALKGINLEVMRGEFLAIIGESGSGKSTLMNILGMLDGPTSGRYILSGIDASELSSSQKPSFRNEKIGFIFQGFNLVPRLTALENLELPLMFRGVSKKERVEICKNALAEVGMGDRIHHKPSELSGGQQQRIAIARAVVTQPEIILADEPTGSLDSLNAEIVMDILKKLNANGSTIIVITHDKEISNKIPRCINIAEGVIK